jgi:hypothetical protein
MELKEFKDFKEAEEFLYLKGLSSDLLSILSEMRNDMITNILIQKRKTGDISELFQIPLNKAILDDIEEKIRNIFVECWNNLLYDGKAKDGKIPCKRAESSILILIIKLRKRGE